MKRIDDSFVFRGIEFKNRLIASPISINLSNLDGTVSDEDISYYGSIAKSGVSYVTVGATALSVSGHSTSRGLRCHSTNYLKGFEKLNKEIKKHANSCIQVFHAGQQINPEHTGFPPVGSSEYVVPDIGVNARVLSIDEIENIEEEFVSGISRLFDVGFDFVEIHAAHGYLLNGFISPHMNRRKDKYGGSEENRFRILKNIINGLEKLDHNYLSRLNLRLSASDFISGGLSENDLSSWKTQLSLEKLAIITASMGIYESAKMKPLAMKEGRYRESGRLIKGLLPNNMVVSQGGIRWPEYARKILEEDNVDLIGLGQALIADNNWASKALMVADDTIIKCTECGRCRYIKRKQLDFDCVRPEAFHSRDSKWTKRKLAKNSSRGGTK